ncbi:poly-gamma-glutamate synthesis protein (capsule biosynthesis protein) [Bacillus ectoiniformans]|uniref:CapA family protein n=1 Tax=Bacillus ectoiniformans TaxID=1494429 RepID=UPI00195DBF12|nr:CapA family protein [Bacillus ectoiniformans]MBM7650229.1 poly-gamma-glutamate synthesis protein (capsule biosynthesis protein) [Bacillus ectoiniformans]
MTRTYKRKNRKKKQFILMGMISVSLTLFLSLLFVYIGLKEDSPPKEALAAEKTQPQVNNERTQATPPNEKIPPEPKAEPAAVSHQPITLSFAGDVLLDRSVGESIKKHGVDYPFKGTAKVFQSTDIAALNLETSVSTRGKPANKQFTFRSRPETLRGVKNAGIDVVSLANNHTLDYGVDALYDTMKHLDDYKIGHTGAGKNEKDAFSARYIDVKGKKVAIIGISRVLPEVSWFATGSKPGIANAYHNEPMMTHVKKAVKNSDYTIVMIHWNRERQDYPEPYARQMAKMFIDAGVDGVIGSHSHCLQGIEYYKGAPIYYSLGNFIFTKSGDPRGRETMMVKMTIDQKKGISTSVVPAQIFDGQPRLMDNSYNQKIYKKLSSISYNMKVDQRGNVIKK